MSYYRGYDYDDDRGYGDGYRRGYDDYRERDRWGGRDRDRRRDVGFDRRDSGYGRRDDYDRRRDEYGRRRESYGGGGRRDFGRSSWGGGGGGGGGGFKGDRKGGFRGRRGGGRENGGRGRGGSKRGFSGRDRGGGFKKPRLMNVDNWGKGDRHSVMESYFMETVPENLAEEWQCIVCPSGKRGLVVAANSITQFYTKEGQPDLKFKSSLPNGSPIQNEVMKYHDLTILDAVYCEDKKKIFILDLLHWKHFPYYESEAEFRAYFLPEKMKLLTNPSEVSDNNEHPLIILENFTCTPSNIEQALKKVDYKVEGLLFINKKSTYECSDSTNSLLLRLDQMEKLLGIPVPEGISYTETGPDDDKWREELEERKKLKAARDAAKEAKENEKEAGDQQAGDASAEAGDATAEEYTGGEYAGDEYAAEGEYAAGAEYTSGADEYTTGTEYAAEGEFTAEGEYTSGGDYTATTGEAYTSGGGDYSTGENYSEGWSTGESGQTYSTSNFYG